MAVSRGVTFLEPWHCGSLTLLNWAQLLPQSPRVPLKLTGSVSLWSSFCLRERALHHGVHVFTKPFPDEQKEICSQSKMRTKVVYLLNIARNCDFLRPLWVWHWLAFLKSVSQGWRRSASWHGKICIVRTVHTPVSPSTSHFLLPLAQEMLCCFPPLLVQHSGHKFNFPALLFQKATFLPH